MFFCLNKGGANRRQVPFALGVIALMAGSGSAFAQDEEDDDAIDEITVVGSQIKGANITDALAVTVVSAEAIGQMGVDSMDDLMALIPENGQNFFN